MRDERCTERSRRVRRRSRLGARRVSARCGVPAYGPAGGYRHTVVTTVNRKRLTRIPGSWLYRITGRWIFKSVCLRFGSRPGIEWCKDREPGRIDTDRAAIVAGQFVLSGQNGRSSRFRSYGPPLREERLRSFRSRTNRPATMADRPVSYRPGRARRRGAGAWQTERRWGRRWPAPGRRTACRRVNRRRRF